MFFAKINRKTNRKVEKTMRNEAYPYRIIHIFSLLFAVYMVGLGLFVDFNPTWYMSLWEKVVIYFTPVLLLFFDMKLHLHKLEDRQEKVTLQHKTMRRIFLIYLIALATLLFLGSTFRLGFFERNIWHAKPFTKEHFKDYCNFKFFKSIKMYYHAYLYHSMTTRTIVLNLLGNLIAFAPFGFFISVLYRKKFKNIFFFTVLVIGASILCEFIQFITMVGQADVDDVLLNTIGAVMMYIFMYLPPIHKLTHKILPYGNF